jgi:superfamily II DNA helicase RecQ
LHKYVLYLSFSDFLQILLSSLDAICGIIYVIYRMDCIRLKKILETEIDDLRGKIGIIHGKLNHTEKLSIYENWMSISSPVSIMIATGSFSLGINNPKCSFVYHYGLPLSLSNYVQEIGRCGRTIGTFGEAIIFTNPKLDREKWNIVFSRENQSIDENMEMVLRYVNLKPIDDCRRNFLAHTTKPYLLPNDLFTCLDACLCNLCIESYSAKEYTNPSQDQAALVVSAKEIDKTMDLSLDLTKVSVSYKTGDLQSAIVRSQLRQVGLHVVQFVKKNREWWSSVIPQNLLTLSMSLEEYVSEFENRSSINS